MLSRLRWTAVVLGTCLAAPSAMIAQTGTITGKVTDKNTKQPVEQAQITVEGTSYGIHTKANGTYTILGIPPGTYNLNAKRVGYESVQAQNVQVRIDVTRTQDFELASSATGGFLPNYVAPAQPLGGRGGSLAAVRNSAGPGAAFGIDAYQCANCGIARIRDSVHTVYTFGSEPVVLAVNQNSGSVKPGDVIVAVNGVPITTRAGADLFAYPPDTGELRLTLRRNGTNMDVTSYGFARPALSQAILRLRGYDSLMATVAASMRGGGRGGRGGAGAGGAAAGGRGVLTLDSAMRAHLCATFARIGDGDTSRVETRLAPCPPDSLPRAAGARSGGGGRGGALPGGIVGANIVSPAALPPLDAISSTVELRNYGFTLSCRPDCTRMRSRAGIVYWKFDGYPAVAVQTLAKDGLAAKAGIREGDVLISVNGLSPLSEEGAVLLNRSDRELELTVEFSRGGKREKFVLKL